MITLKDLAQKLEVSVSTVSKALNGSPEISKITIERVKALAEFYNYKPNKIALSLRQNQTKTIGVLIPNILNRFFAKVLHGIQEEATRFGYNIIVCITNESLSKESESLKLLVNGSVDGFILAVSEETQIKDTYDHFLSIQEADIPMVMFDRVMEAMNCDKVIIDDSGATYNATKYLLDEGRQQVVFISQIHNLNVGKLREIGYRKAIQEANISAASLILNIDQKSDAHNQLRAFLSSNPIDGIIAADNMSGTMAINIAASEGYQIPKDLSVLGFADDIVSNLSVPKLSCINQNAEKIGARSVNLLVDRLKNSTPDKGFKTEVIATSIDRYGSNLMS